MTASQQQPLEKPAVASLDNNNNNNNNKAAKKRKLCKQSMTLSDGRTLAYFIDAPENYNNDDTVQQQLPYIFAFHAMFLSKKAFFMDTVQPKDYILVSVDRPGYFGSSAPKHNVYTYELFSRDIDELAKHLKVETFSVVGHSSGGPYALACAAFLKDRVTSIGLLASDPEYASDKVPGEAQTDAMFDCMMGCFLPRLMWFLSPVYRVNKGLRMDFTMERLPYPFETEEIQQPALVVLAQNDTILPREVAIWTHNRLPHSELREMEGVGHMDLLRDDILDQVFSDVAALTKAPTKISANEEKKEEPKSTSLRDERPTRPPQQESHTAGNDQDPKAQTKDEETAETVATDAA